MGQRISTDMTAPAFEPREGGVKVVFDVQESDVENVTRVLTKVGFDVRHYYSTEKEHIVGGSPPGWIRLGAEKRMREFTLVEQEVIVAGFDEVWAASGFICDRQGTDSWTAG